MRRGAPTLSREAELVYSLDRATEIVMKTIVNQSAMPKYTGPIPPKDAAADKDNGFSQLTPELYIQRRLDDQVDFYHRRTIQKSAELRTWQVIGLLASGAGTFLAAVQLNLWVALTTAIAAASAGYLQYRLTEQTLMQYNQTAASLEAIKAWWIALPPESKADPIKVRLLVDTAERVMATEQTGWMQGMENALDNLRNEMPPSAPPLPGGTAAPTASGNARVLNR